MSHTILTMSRGDETRLHDWIEYHSSIGFDRFIILLDDPIDDSFDVATKAAAKAGVEILVERLAAYGTYFDGLTPSERSRALKAWRTEHQADIDLRELPIIDPLSDRQYRYFPECLDNLAATDPEGWVTIIDVDEYLVVPEASTIVDLTNRAEGHRLRFKNFNFDTTHWDGRSNVRKFTSRWTEAAIDEFANGWQNRVKSLVRTSHALPLVSVHAISRGPFKILPTSSYRLHHYRFPTQGVPIPYAAIDTTIAPQA